MDHHPTGTVTLLLTDIEGSTSLWERDEAAMHRAMESHDQAAAEVFAENEGKIVKARGEGDSLFVVFSSPTHALPAALAFRRRLSEVSAEFPFEVRTRIAIHTGDVAQRDGDFYGLTVNRCARLRGICHGGQIVVSQATYHLLRATLPSSIVVTDLGSHRLRDLLLPERVYQLDDGPTVFPALRSLNIQPNNLPNQLTTFVGRRMDVDSVSTAVSRHRLVTLLGTGGAGKTRLAIQVAAESTDDFPDGVWFVALSEARTLEQIRSAIAGAISSNGDDAATYLEDPVAILGEAPVALLVLDNAEHAIKEIASVADDILRRHSGVRLLVTSRQPLRVEGEIGYRVESLSLPDVNDPDTFATSEAVQLFVDRASQRVPGFRLRPANATALAAICVRLDGLPLAIEQAASMVSFLSPSEIEERLRDCFDVLDSSEIQGNPRHRTLQAAIEWSFRMLDATEQLLFTRLSIFAGTFSLSGAEASVSDEDLPRGTVLRLLRSLVDKSMVVAGTPDDGETRYRMLEAVADYAGRRLTAKDATHDRFFGWALGLSRSAESEVVGPDQAQWLAKLDKEHANLLEAIEWGFKKRDEKVVDVVYGLRRFWLRRGYIVDGIGYVGRCLRTFSLPPERAAQLRNTLGAYYWRRGETECARVEFEASLKLLEAAGDDRMIAWVVNNLGILASDSGDYEKAIDFHYRSLRILQHGGDKSAALLTMLNVAMAQVELERYDEALRHLSDAQNLAISSQDAAREALVYSAMADVLVRRGELRAAAQQLRKAFSIWSTVSDPFSMSDALLDVAQLALHTGRPEDAASLVRGFLGVTRRTGSPPNAQATRKAKGIQEKLGSLGFPAEGASVATHASLLDLSDRILQLATL